MFYLVNITFCDKRVTKYIKHDFIRYYWAELRDVLRG
jgi:hypothetical protein